MLPVGDFLLFPHRTVLRFRTVPLKLLLLLNLSVAVQAELSAALIVVLPFFDGNIGSIARIPVAEDAVFPLSQIGFPSNAFSSSFCLFTNLNSHCYSSHHPNFPDGFRKTV